MSEDRASGVRGIWCALFVVTLMATTNGEARAQERAGLMGGISFGAGTVDFSGTSSDPAVGIIRQDGAHRVDLGLNMYLGAVANRRTALLFEVSLANSRTDSVDGEVRVGPRRVTFASSTSSLTSLVLAGAAQYWLTSNVWIRGGFGGGYLDRDLAIEDADLTITLEKGTGFAVLAAAGIDLWRRANFALDTEFHFTTFSLEGLRINAPTVQVGFTWY